MKPTPNDDGREAREGGGTTAVPISTILITLNAMPLVERSLKSVGWADEIVVVDGGSQDGTVETVRRYTEKIFPGEVEAYARNREIAVEHARNRWIFWVDADEEVSPALAREIQTLAEGDFRRYSGFTVPRRTKFLGRWMAHCGWYPDRNLRLFDRERSRLSRTRLHEQVEINGLIKDLDGELLHRHEGGLTDYLVKFERYTRLAAEDLWDQGIRCQPWALVPRAMFTFFRMYVLQRGFRDGVQGLILAGLSGAYTFTKYARLWEFQQKREEAVGR